LFSLQLATHVINEWKPDATKDSPGVSCLLTLAHAVLVGTITDGLFLMQEGELKKHITSSHGLVSNRVSSVTYHDSTLWIGSDNGVSIYNLRSDTCFHLNKTKGLLAQEVYDVALSNSLLWVSHAQGLQVFKEPDFLNLQKPVVRIKSVSSNGQPMKLKNGIKLSPESRQLTISFDVSNNLRAQGSTSILYRIRELDENHWQHTTLKNPIANYLSLPYGKLTLDVKAENENGIVSANIVSLPITVLAPVWKQPWFIAMSIFVIIIICTLLIYLRLKKINTLNKLRLQQINLAQELRIAQLTSIRAQMNPHFIFNTMALIQGKVLNGLKDEANQHIQVFSALLRSVLDFSTKEMIHLHEEIDILEKYLSIEKDRFGGALEYTISQDEHTRNELIQIPTLLTQPFIENALRHGLMHREGRKVLLIDFSLRSGTLTIRIDDNGIGRFASAEFNKQRNKEHNSFAIKAYQKRIDLLNATRSNKIKLTITDKYSDQGLPTGTLVIIQIPIENENN
jgi:hypothetical protein